MAVYKIFPTSDASIYSKYPAKNAGLDEILEVSVKNTSDSTNSLIAGTDNFLTDDLRRSIIKFSNSDLEILRSYATGSWKSFLKLYIADAENITQEYTLEVKQMYQSWQMGTGKFSDSPETRNGVCWYTSQSYYTSASNWINPSYFKTAGGGSWTSISASQTFDLNADKDVNADVTNIVNSWFSGSYSNNGLLIKHPTLIENSSGSYISLNYFSNDTHTIYPPSLDIRWDDSSYITGSLSIIDNSNCVITMANNVGTYKADTSVYKFRINSRDKFPTRTFTTSSVYLNNKALPITSYWSIQDVKTNDIVIDFDTSYTKISCDSISSYFNLYMSGLEPERYYKILIKTHLSSGEIIDIDNNLIFKIVK